MPSCLLPSCYCFIFSIGARGSSPSALCTITVPHSLRNHLKCPPASFSTNDFCSLCFSSWDVCVNFDRPLVCIAALYIWFVFLVQLLLCHIWSYLLFSHPLLFRRLHTLWRLAAFVWFVFPSLNHPPFVHRCPRALPSPCHEESINAYPSAAAELCVFSPNATSVALHPLFHLLPTCALQSYCSLVSRPMRLFPAFSSATNVRKMGDLIGEARRSFLSIQSGIPPDSCCLWLCPQIFSW